MIMSRRACVDHGTRRFEQTVAPLPLYRCARGKPKARQHAMAGKSLGAVEQCGVLRGHQPALQPDARHFNRLQHGTAYKRLMGCGQAQTQHVPTQHLCPGRKRKAQVVLGDAGVIGQCFERQPFQACAGFKLRHNGLRSHLTGAPIKPGGPGCGDKGVAIGIQVQVQTHAIAAHHAAGCMHQYLVADCW